jgi:hypothetical protein
MTKPLLGLVGLALLAAVPLLSPPDYLMHVLITVLLTALAGTGWAMMGRYGLVSFGHGAFLGLAAYTMALLWNEAGLTPWIGIPLGMLVAIAAGVLLAYPAFRLRVVGHYFALVTLDVYLNKGGLAKVGHEIVQTRHLGLLLLPYHIRVIVLVPRCKTPLSGYPLLGGSRNSGIINSVIIYTCRMPAKIKLGIFVI